MTAKQKFRMSIDLTMTVLSLVLMGGNYFFPWDGVHEVLGVALLVLWAVHVGLNRGFYKSLFKGKYNAFRILQAIINVGILLCAVLLMVSGIMLSNHVFVFLGIEFGADFARTAHLLSSHWYFVFMSLHIGMHVGVIARQIAGRKKSSANVEPKSNAGKIIRRSILALACAYGVYAFVVRNIGKYLLFLQPFFFFDIEKGYVLFFVDYVCIMVAIATAGFYLCEAAKKAGRK